MKLSDLKAAEKVSTPVPWVSHFADDATACNCKSILAEYGGMGSVLNVSVCKEMHGVWGDDNGPPPEIAKANAKFVVASRELVPQMIDLLEQIDKDLEKVFNALICAGDHARARGIILKIQKSIRDL